MTLSRLTDADHLILTPPKQSSFDWENSLPRWSTNLSFDSMFGSVSYDVQPGTGYELSSGQTNMLTTQPNTFYDYYPYTNSREIGKQATHNKVCLLIHSAIWH